MKLITETIEDIEVLTEANANGGKSYKIKGVFMQADIKNRNGRVYPVQTLANEVARYTKEFINKKRAFGELGHPDGPTVNLERVSHMITSLKPEGRTVRCIIKRYGFYSTISRKKYCWKRLLSCDCSRHSCRPISTRCFRRRYYGE